MSASKLGSTNNKTGDEKHAAAKNVPRSSRPPGRGLGPPGPGKHEEEPRRGEHDEGQDDQRDGKRQGTRGEAPSPLNMPVRPHPSTTLLLRVCGYRRTDTPHHLTAARVREHSQHRGVDMPRSRRTRPIGGRVKTHRPYGVCHGKRGMNATGRRAWKRFVGLGSVLGIQSATGAGLSKGTSVLQSSVPKLCDEPEPVWACRPRARHRAHRRQNRLPCQRIVPPSGLQHRPTNRASSRPNDGQAQPPGWFRPKLGSHNASRRRHTGGAANARALRRNLCGSRARTIIKRRRKRSGRSGCPSATADNFATRVRGYRQPNTPERRGRGPDQLKPPLSPDPAVAPGPRGRSP